VSAVETFSDDLTSWIWAREYRTLLTRQPLSWSTVTNLHLSKPYRVNDVFSMSPVVQRLTSQENQPWSPAYVWRNYVSNWPWCQWTCFKRTLKVSEGRTGQLNGGTQATLISQRTQQITLLVGVYLWMCPCVCVHIYRKIWSSYFTWLYDKVLFPVSYCLHAWTVPLWPQTKENMCLPTSAVKSPGRNPSRQKFRRKWWLPCCSGTSLFTPKLLSNKWRFTTAEHELDRLFKWWAQRTSTAVT
jgi:hypothetical protein